MPQFFLVSACWRLGSRRSSFLQSHAEAVFEFGDLVAVFADLFAGLDFHLDDFFFEVADAWDAASLVSSLERCGVGPPSLLLLDVGGLSGSSGTLDALALIRVLCALFHSSLRVLVIKSSCMRTLAMQLRPTREVVPPDAKQGQFGRSDH